LQLLEQRYTLCNEVAVELDAQVAARRAAAEVLLLLLVPQADAARITTDNLLEVGSANNVQCSLLMNAVQGAAVIPGAHSSTVASAAAATQQARSRAQPYCQLRPLSDIV
jgi:hypothetical protein